jgi:hypothetical protein
VDFNIDPACLTSVIVRREWNRFADKPVEQLTDDDLLCILEGKHLLVSTGTADHPEFDALRRSLSSQGYIRMETGWWNGDRVLKPFRLNGALFRTGEQFSCGSAIAYDIASKVKNKVKTQGDIA